MSAPSANTERPQLLPTLTRSGPRPRNSYVAIGLPAALLLAFRTPLGAVGIAMGHTLGKLAMTLLTGGVVARTDWRGESETAVRRLKEHAAGAADGAVAELSSTKRGSSEPVVEELEEKWEEI